MCLLIAFWAKFGRSIILKGFVFFEEYIDLAKINTTYNKYLGLFNNKITHVQQKTGEIFPK